MSYNGTIYDLGQILPLFVGGRVQFMIVPTFTFRPPFLCLTLLHAHRRLEYIAKQNLNEGQKIPVFVTNRCITQIEPFFHIDAQ
jgi:hypothetical protein